MHKRLKIGSISNPIGRVDVDHLHAAGKVFTLRERAHHQQAVAQDEAVGPVHVALVELDCLVVLLLGVCPEIALDVLPRGDADGGLGGHPLVYVEGDGIELEVLLLPLAGPLQPGLTVPQRVGEGLGLLFGQLAPCGLFEKLRETVGLAGAVESQRRRQVRVVVVPLPGGSR